MADMPNKEGVSISEDNWWLPLLRSEVRGILSKTTKIVEVITFPAPSKPWKEAAIDNTADENARKATRWKTSKQPGESICCRGSRDWSATHQIIFLLPAGRR